MTVFGESAGSVNVCALLAAPSALGLFQRAVMQSGPCPWPLPTMATAERTGQVFAAQLGCTDPARVLDCLRGRPVEQIVGASGQSAILTAPTWAPVVGGRTLPRAPVDAVAAGSAAGVSVLLGTVRDEGRAFTTGYDPGGEITGELPYLFRSVTSDAPHAAATAGERALSAAMVDYWTRFAATGDPNRPARGAVGAASGEPALPAWPAWPATSNSIRPDRLALEPGEPAARAGYAVARHCDIWG